MLPDRRGPSTGTSWDQPWLPASAIQTGGTLTYALADTPDTAWAAAPAESPPSFGTGTLPAVGFSLPSGSVTLTAGQGAAVQLGVAAAVDGAASIDWQVSSVPPGLQVTPTSGTLTLTRAAANGDSGASCTPRPVLQMLRVTSQSPGSSALRLSLHTSSGVALPPVVVDVVTQP